MVSDVAVLGLLGGVLIFDWWWLREEYPWLRSINNTLPYTIKDGQLTAGNRPALPLRGSVLTPRPPAPTRPRRSSC